MQANRGEADVRDLFRVFIEYRLVGKEKPRISKDGYKYLRKEQHLLDGAPPYVTTVGTSGALESNRMFFLKISERTRPNNVYSNLSRSFIYSITREAKGIHS